MTKERKIWAIVPAAGSGVRMRASVPKQYLSLLGQPVILHTLERLCAYPRISGVVVGLARDDAQWKAMQTTHLNSLLGTFIGGATRARTVLNGLESLVTRAHDDDWVMVHDAVRPCVRHADLDRLVAAVGSAPDGALLAIPVSDTVKRADTEARVTETVSRSGLWRALTPQMFRIGILREALSGVVAAGEDITDDCAAVERVGARPRLVEGSADNIKITHPRDLMLAEIFLNQQARESR